MIDLPKSFTSPEGREYTLNRSTWAHIASGRGEVVGHIDEIKRCVEGPDDVFQSDQRSCRYIYRRAPEDMDYEYFVVVVDRSSDIVVTAYATDTDNF